MWAIKRASTQLRNPVSNLGTKQKKFMSSLTGRKYKEVFGDGVVEPRVKLSNQLVDTTWFFRLSCIPASTQNGFHSFSSKASDRSCVEQHDDGLMCGLDDTKRSYDQISGVASDDEFGDVMKSHLDPNENVLSDLENDIESTGGETDLVGSRETSAWAPSGVTKAILASLSTPVNNILDKWVEEGNEITLTQAMETMRELQKRRLFDKALQLSEWMQSAKHIEFLETNYATHAHLVGKVHGILKAEEYVQTIPESYRGVRVYGSLLANMVFRCDVQKAEMLFSKMRKLFPLTCYSCNQMILLYKRTDFKKADDILLLMENENVKWSTFTYHVLVDLKGQVSDISGMEKIVERMKSEGMNPSAKLNAALARYYIAAGLNDKAETIIKEIEGGDKVKLRFVSHLLLRIYASLGKEEEVARIWKLCEDNPRVEECVTAIETWGKLNRIENAELAFEKLANISRKLASKYYVVLLNVYADHKMLEKGKELVTKMSTGRETDAPHAVDAIIKLYVKAGEVEKADSILQKTLARRLGKPFFSTFFTILDAYSRRGDIHNSEKIFLYMRRAGYVSRVRPYLSLLHAYDNGRQPAYGFRERMRGDGVPFTRPIAGLLDKTDAFRKSPLASLLE